MKNEFWVNKIFINRDLIPAVIVVTLFMISLLLTTGKAHAIPAFGRKYDMTCNSCHTREPRLNPFGQRFQENGYQLPETEDGSTVQKDLLGGPLNGVTLDDVTNYFAVRLRADLRQADFRENTSATDDPELVFPTIVNLFFGGTATRDISFFLEAEYNDAESHFGFERAMLIFDNLGGHQIANVKVGDFDPSSFFSFPTHRQQLNPIPPEAESSVFPPEIARIPLLPFAFSSKMYGLTMGPDAEDSEGYSILPFEPFLYNSPHEKGVTVYGRPFGRSFLYQVGMAQGDTAEDKQDTRWDFYGMLRYDIFGTNSDFQVSGFYYHASDAARPTINPSGTPIYADPVDWNRYGIGARWQYKFIDIYGTIIMDKIDSVHFAGAPANLSQWDDDGLGASLEADWLLNRRWLLGVRYDYMDPGGLVKLPPALQGTDPEINQVASFLGVIAKFYPVPNVGLYARAHVNLMDSKILPTALGGGEHPATNLKYMATIGVDMAF
jgi:hypothetical protein